MGRNAETLELFDSTDLDAKLVETNYNNAVGYLKIGEIELANQAALRAIKIDADHPPTQALLKLIKQEYFVNGLTSIKENKISDGIRAFQSAITIDSTFIDAYCEIGRAFFIQGELNEAEKAAKKVLRLDSSSGSARELLEKVKCSYYDRARAYLRQDEFTSAEKAIRETLRLDSDYEPARKLLKKIKNSYYYQGMTFLEQSLYNEAIVSFESALALDADFMEAYCGIVRAYLNQGVLASAEDTVREVLRLDPNYEPANILLVEIKNAYYNFGIEYLRQGKFTDAEKASAEVLRLDPSDELLLKMKDVYCNQGRTYFNRGKFDFAVKTVREILRLDSGYEPARELFEEIKEAYYARGLNFLKENNYGAAITTFENLLVMDANFREAHYGMVRAHLGRGEFAAAKKANEKLLRLDPSFSLLEDIKFACYERGRMCFTQGKLADAYNAVRDILCLDSNYEPAHVLLGEIRRAYYESGCTYLMQVELTDAKRVTDEILRLDSSYELACDLLIKIKHLHQARGTIFLHEERDEEANSDFQKAAAIDVDFTEEGYVKAYCHLGDFYLHKNELDSAHFATAQALNLDSRCKPVQGLVKRLKHAFYNRMICFLNENQYDAAINSFESLLLIDPHFLKATWRDALTFLGHGNLEATKRTVSEILEYDSDCGFESEDDFASTVLENIKHVYYSRGLTFLEGNQYNEAVINFEYAIAIDVNFTEAYVGIRDAYLEFAGVFLGSLDLTEEGTAEINVEAQISERIDSLAIITELMVDVEYSADETRNSKVYKEKGSSSLTNWIRNIANYPLLTREKEIELAKQIEVGKTEYGYTADAEQARDQLVQANLRLVISIARKYQGQNVPLEDLIQEGNIGLIKAASKFDYRDGFKFSNYAKQWIKWEIMRALDNSSRLIRLPSYFIKRIIEFDAVYATLCQKLQREPYREEIAESLDLTVAQVEEIIMSKVDSVSMDLSLGSERSVETVGDLIDDLIEDSKMSEHEGPIAEMINEDLIAHLFRELPEREQNILKMRFGLEDEERKTLREISVALGVTRERVRQLEIEAIKRLRVLYDEMGEFQSDQAWARKTTV